LQLRNENGEESQNYKALTLDTVIFIQPEIGFVLIGPQSDRKVQHCREADQASSEYTGSYRVPQY
jgi:hypothetical protein